MQLDQLQANIRLRKPWETIDLGFAMVQAWWRTLWLPWLLLLSFIMILLWYLLPTNMVGGFTVLILWWLKPLYDRVLLHILSHNLFNDKKSTLQVLADIPQLLKSTGLISALTFRRFSSSRGFNLSVWQLEKLRGKERAKRQRLLLAGAHSHAVGLTHACIILEIAIILSLIGLVLLFLPSNMAIDVLEAFESKEQDVMFICHLAFSLIVYFTYFIVEPLHIAASFALYLNRRTALEAWDIELSFRHMAKRLNALAEKTAVVCMALLCAFSVSLFISDSFSVYAESEKITEEYLAPSPLPASESSRIITEVLSGDEFSKESKTTKIQFKRSDKESAVSNTRGQTSYFSGVFVAQLLKALLLVALLVGIIFIIIKRDKWIHWFDRTKKESTYQTPDILFGMDIRPESLPEDIPGAAKGLWQEKQYREALSLLYRGALMQLVNFNQVPLDSSHTEGDVLKLTATLLETNQQNYLQRLTASWQQVAYAHRVPQTEEAHYLFAQWQSDFIQDSE